MSVSQAPMDEDPRVTRSRAVVRAAAREELAEVGLGGFTIDGVASRAGVGRSTIYRHWGDRMTLVRDAISSASPQPPPEPTRGDPLGRVHELAHHLVEAMSDPATFRFLIALVAAAEQDEQVAAIHHADMERRRGALVEALQAARDAEVVRGDLDPELAAACIAGAIVHQRMIRPRPVGPDEVDALVAQVIGPPPVDPAPPDAQDR